MSDPAIITNLLQQTLIGSTQSIGEAQKKLKNMHSDPNFLPNLLRIPLESTIPYNVQKSAVIYTLKIARDFIEVNDKEKLDYIAKILVSFMIQNQIQITLMKHLSSTIQLILANDHKFQIRNHFQSNYVQMLQTATSQADSNIKYQFLGLCAQMILGSTKHITKQFNQFLKVSLINFVNINIRVMHHVKNAAEQGQRDNIMRCFRILKIYSYAIKLYLKKIQYADIQTLKLLYEEQLCKLLMFSFELTLGNNQLSTSLIFFQRNQDNDLVQLLHSIKADYITAFTSMSRSIIQNFKQPKMILTNIILQNQNIFPTFINSVTQLFSKCPYHKIRSRSTIKLVQQLLHVLIIGVRCNVFYNIFKKQKQTILNGCIFNTLLFSPDDFQNYQLEPEQFICEILQIIEMDPHQYLASSKRQNIFDAQGYQQVQSYSTLRTVSSTFLNAYCKYIDGTLPEIFQFAFNVFKNDSSQQKLQVPKTLLLCLMGILRDSAGSRENLIEQVVMLLMGVLCNRQIPKTSNQDQHQQNKQKQQKSIQYLMLLVVLYKYLPKVKGIEEKILPPLTQIIQKILLQTQCSDALKFMSYDLVTVLTHLDDHCKQNTDTNKNQQQQKYGIKFIKLMNNLLKIEYRNAEKILETMYYLYKYKDNQIYQHPQILIATVQHLSQIIYKQSSLNQQSITKLNINKSWNIITDISQNQTFIPQFINQIEQAVIPLLQFIDGKRQLDYQENIFMMMSSFIRKSKQVTQNQLVMFEIIPKLFYTQYNYLFGHAFQTLQIFMLYGNNILANAPQAIHTIIDMSIASLNTTQLQLPNKQIKKHNQAQNCQGALILHGLILSCGKVLDTEMYMKIAKSLDSRLQNPRVKTNILKSSIITGLALVVMMGYKSFSYEDSDVLLNTVLQNIHSCTLKQPCKTMIICLTQLLTLVQLPFIANRYTFLLDSIISLMQLLSTSKDLFNRKPLTDQQRDYNIISSLVANSLDEIDEIEYFKKKIKQIKQKYPQALQQSFNQLPESNKDYLKGIMNTIAVVGDKRKIFKITKNV